MQVACSTSLDLAQVTLSSLSCTSVKVRPSHCMMCVSLFQLPKGVLPLADAFDVSVSESLPAPK